MKVVVAIDSLKGSLSSLEAGEAIKSGVQKVMPNAVVDVRPLADGGEGTVEALALGMGGELKKTRKIEKLEAELNQAVSQQNFERAAELRDKIRDMRKNA